MQRIIVLIMCATIAAILTACSTASTSPTPSATASTAANTTPRSSANTSTQASEEAATSASSPAEPQASTAPAERNNVTLWHSFADGSPEQQTLAALLDTARQAMPETKLDMRFVPGDQLSDRFEIEAVAGGGPDAFIASGDGLVRQAQAGFLRNLDNDLAAQRATFAPNAIEALTLDGKLYAVPLSRSTIAMYFNRGKVAAPPQTTQQLIDAAKSGARIVLIRSSYHNFGFFGAFGGRLLDESGRCVADAGGVADALRYLRDLKAAGAQFVTDGAEAEARFKTGEADITLNGSWLLTDFRTTLGDQLGVAAIPAGPAGPAKPLVSSSGIFVNASAPQAEKAVALALQLTSPEAQVQWADQAGQTPTNPSVAIANDAVGGVAAAALSGIARSQRPELDAAWQPFDSALAEVLENDADPVAAVQAACAATNAANGK